MPSAAFTSAGSSSSSFSSSNKDTTINGDSPDVVLLVFAYVVPCIFTIGLLLYLFYCCDSNSKKNVEDDNDGETNSRGLPNEETSLLPTTTKDYIPPATKEAPDVEEGVSKPLPTAPPTSGLGSYFPQFMKPTPSTTEKPSTDTTTDNKDPALLTPTLDNITKALPKATVATPKIPEENNGNDNNNDEPNKPATSSFPSLYFNPMDLMNGGAPATDKAVAPAKVPVQFVIPSEGNKATPSTSIPVTTGLPTVPTTLPTENGPKESKEPSSSAFPTLYFNPLDLMPTNTAPEGTTTVPSSTSFVPSTTQPVPETNGTTLLPNMPSMSNLLNPMDILGTLNPTNIPSTPVAGPPMGPPVMEGVARDLVDRNNPVLFEIYLFYSFHAAAVLNARMDGHVTPMNAKDLDQHKAVAQAIDRYDRTLLGHNDFMQLLKDFKVLMGPVTGPFVTALLSTEESKLTFRRFVALLLTIGETLQPRYPKQDAFLALLETMDYSEQLYIILESGLVLNKEVSFDVNEPTWRSVINEDIKK